MYYMAPNSTCLPQVYPNPSLFLLPNFAIFMDNQYSIKNSEPSPKTIHCIYVLDPIICFRC